MEIKETKVEVLESNRTTANIIYGDYSMHYEGVKEQLRHAFPESVLDVEIIGVEVNAEIEYDVPFKAYMCLSVLLCIKTVQGKEKHAMGVKRLVDGITPKELDDWLDVVLLQELADIYEPKQEWKTYNGTD